MLRLQSKSWWPLGRKSEISSEALHQAQVVAQENLALLMETSHYLQFILP